MGYMLLNEIIYYLLLYTHACHFIKVIIIIIAWSHEGYNALTNIIQSTANPDSRI